MKNYCAKRTDGQVVFPVLIKSKVVITDDEVSIARASSMNKMKNEAHVFLIRKQLYLILTHLPWSSCILR